MTTTKQLDILPSSDDPILPMRQREAEPDRAYHAFLVWALQDQGNRSLKWTARTAKIPESNLRFWSKKWGWKARIAAVTSHEIAAFQLFQGRLAELSDPEKLIILKDAFESVLKDKAPASLRSYVRRQRQGLEDPPKNRKEEIQQAKAVTPDPSLATSVKDRHLKDKDVSKQVMLIDACLGLIAKKVQAGELEVSVKDIPALIKARALLTGLPTQNVAVQAQVTHTHVQSVRVQRAQALNLGQSGVVAAMKEDLQELSLIMDQIEPDNTSKTLIINTDDQEKAS